MYSPHSLYCCLSVPLYYGNNTEGVVYLWAPRYSWAGSEGAAKPSRCGRMLRRYLKDLSQNWQGYGKPAPPSSSPPVAVPRSQQPSGIWEGDATSLLEGEEGTQDRPAGSSSPSEGRGWHKKVYFYTQLRDWKVEKKKLLCWDTESGGKTGRSGMIKEKSHLSWMAKGRSLREFTGGNKKKI